MSYENGDKASDEIMRVGKKPFCVDRDARMNRHNLRSGMMAKKKTAAIKQQRSPPIKIPLDFDTTVGGLVRVKPEPTKKKRAEKK